MWWCALRIEHVVVCPVIDWTIEWRAVKVSTSFLTPGLSDATPVLSSMGTVPHTGCRRWNGKLFVLCTVTFLAHWSYPFRVSPITVLSNNHHAILTLITGVSSLTLSNCAYSLYRMLLLRTTKANQTLPTSEQCGGVTSHSCRNWRYLYTHSHTVNCA